MASFGNKKKLVSLLALLCFWNILYSQDLKCFNQHIDLSKRGDLLMVLDDYINQTQSKNEIFLVDFLPESDTVNKFRILSSDHTFEILFKKPDCYCTYRNNIIYLYTPTYTQQKDTVWLQQILTETVKLLSYPQYNVQYRDSSETKRDAEHLNYVNKVRVLWMKDSVIYPTYPYNSLAEHYDPITYEYWVVKGKIVNWGTVKNNKMFYPNTGSPKGIFDIYEFLKKDGQ